MKPAKFEHERPADIDATIALLAQADGDAKILAGGQSLVPMMNLRLAQPGLLVDIGGIDELRAVEDDGDHLRIGASVTHATIEDGKLPDVTNGMLPYVAGGIAYRAVRNRGTIGGSVAHADPAADWPAALTALGAEAIARGPSGERAIPLAELIIGPFTPVLELEEIVTALRVPKLSPGAKWAYYKVCRKPGEFAESIGAVVVDRDRDHAAVVIGSTDGAPLQLPEVASRLVSGEISGLSIDEAKQAIRDAGGSFETFDEQIHAVAVSRAIERAFAQ